MTDARYDGLLAAYDRVEPDEWLSARRRMQRERAQREEIRA